MPSRRIYPHPHLPPHRKRDAVPMRKMIVTLCLICLAGAANAAFAISSTAQSATYTGFLDQYSSIGATWGFSNYKLNNASNGHNTYFITVTRASDSTTTNIGWDLNNKASVSAFNTFCSGTTCAATTIYDQVSGNNATCT